jgi:serine/threonine-protein kinase HipA
MTEKLQTFLNRKHLGEIVLDSTDDRDGLVYCPSWIPEGGFPVSPHLKPGESTSESVRRFLANLLPEGKWLEEICAASQVASSNIFALAAAIGSETTGALTFCPGQELSGGLPTNFRPITQHELTERIDQRHSLSITLWDRKTRLSVAGVQGKLPILIMPDGQMGFGEGNLASTHILKFGATRAMHLVINEYICMKLAKRMKLPVAEVSLVRFGEPVLLVKRFDRQWSGEHVDRLHLIDGCQMLDLPPTYKYERPFGKGADAAVIRSGASLPGLFAACRMCRIPALAIRDLLNWILFQLLIGNSDAHGKNISFYVSPAGIDVAPAYDLQNLDMYGSEYDRDLAMAVGDAFDPDDVSPRQLAKMCVACGLPKRQVARTLATLCKNLLTCLDTINVLSELTNNEISFAGDLTEKIKGNTRRYLAFADKLPHIVL